MIDKIIRICTRYMAVGVILAGIFGIFFPSVMKPLSPYIPIMLGIIMFGMGMSLTPGDFRNVFKQPKNVALGSLLQFVIMPALAAVLIQIFALPPAIAIGVVLVGCCPGGTASNVISYIAHADVALSVSMTMVNTILAPFVTPFLIWLIAGAWVDISFTAMMISIIKMVLLPLLAGVGFNYFFPRQVAKVTKVMPMLSALVIIFTVGCVVSLSGRTILDNGLIILAVVILHNLGGMALGFFCARKFGMTKAQIFRHITLLQMIKRIVPPISNEIITLVKDTSLARGIALQEVIWMGESFMKGNSGIAGLVWPLFFTAVYYLIFSGIVTVLLGKLEKKLDFFQ